MKKGKKIIVANWKMNPASLKDARALFTRVAKSASRFKKVQTIICPPFVYLSLFKDRRSTTVALGAQNFSHESQGAYTGEVSVDMITDLGIKHTIIGHSERRALGETNEMINKKIHLALSHDITPIICVGETTRDNDAHYLEVIKEQLEKALVNVSRAHLGDIIIAYEPVWAIGSSAAMEPYDIHQMKIFITKTLVNMYKTNTLSSIPILYGGAVDASNAALIFSHGQVDGFILGRVSLDPSQLSEILTIAQTA